MPPLSSHHTPPDMESHAYALDVSGYTIIPNQLTADEVRELRRSAELALAAEREMAEKQPLTFHTAYYQAVRCFYCWGEVCSRLLEHATVHALADLMMQHYRLWDMTLLATLPTPPDQREAGTTSWHRDQKGLYWGTQVPAYLWFFFCIDDVTPENGATWIVPGSHRLPSRFEEAAISRSAAQPREQYPSSLQLCGQAGDLVVVDPASLHSSGLNHTAQPRRLLNLGVCFGDLPPLVDHWSVAGPAIREGASERLRKFLGGADKPLRKDWPLVPPGWRTTSD